MKDPKLNISYSDFKVITSQLLTEAQINYIFKEASKLRPAVFIQLKPHKVKAEAVRKVLRKSDVGLFNQILTQKRLELNHKFAPIADYDSQFPMLKEVAGDAADFCEIFTLNNVDGYTFYITYGIKLMGKKYALSKFKYYKEKIFSKYEGISMIANDPDKDLTEKIYKTFCRVYNIRHNKDYYEKHIVDFIYIADRCRQSGLRYDKYLEVQINFYKNINKIPEPSFFHTEEAYERTFKLKK